MQFLKPAKFFLTLSGVCVLVSAILLFVPGPELSIDFTGGTLMEIGTQADQETVRTAIASATTDEGEAYGNPSISKTKGGTMLIRIQTLSNEEHLALLDHLGKELGDIDERQFTTIGPTVGASLKRRSIWALTIAAVAIVCYLAFAFRKVPKKLNPWKFGVIAVITLLHDVLITVGVFVVLSHLTAFEFDTLFVTALLTILGYSVNDTIVIFDRIRDNLQHLEGREDFAVTAERSLQESIHRSINTSVSTLIMLGSLFFLGSESVRWFVLTLIVGAIIGTYSSLFLATPLLVYWRKRK